MRADSDAPRHFYFACPECGWCGPLRDGRDTAASDAAKHFMVKEATKDERR
jgi:hypothetical protein